jgi:hypothetical protein
VAAVAQLERLHDTLLDQQNGQAALASDPIDGLEDLLDDPRAQTLRGLVEQEQIGSAMSPRPIASICCPPPDSEPPSWR